MLIEESLLQFLANLTSEPGIYRMLDREGSVLYVGKASNLKKRVTSYFNKNNTSPKTRSLVAQIHSIEVTITRSETEALLLESSLIKSLRPKYNVLLRDDKSYPYIHVSSHPKFPRMEKYRSKKKPQKGEFYGPYPSSAAVQETLNIIQKVFKIRSCRDSYFNARSRPCLQYQIKRCSAPCTQLISVQDYQQAVRDATRFLQGKSQLILEEMAHRMDDAVSRLDFEEATILRDQIKNLRLIQEQQAVMQLRGDIDVIAIEVQPGFACIQCVTVREGEVVASQSFFPVVPSCGLSDADMTVQELWQQVFEAFVAFYYLDTPLRIPPLIITEEWLTQVSVMETMLSQLREKGCQIQIRPRGANLRWLDFTRDNLRLTVTERLSSLSLIQKRYQALAQVLKIEKSIKRMECFDISHTQGVATVASCVVFDEHGPAKREYRFFNIQNVKAGDDYAAMEQVVRRRFKRLLEEQSFPDVLIIDGGKGQVAVAERVLTQLGISAGITLLGIAKGPERKAGWERLILATENEEMSLAPDSDALHLLQYIRDEAHRFAITQHRKKRQKIPFESSLETIEGIGAKRRQALLHRFGGLRELAKAPLEEIEKVKGISKRLASLIFEHFR